MKNNGGIEPLQQSTNKSDNHTEKKTGPNIVLRVLRGIGAWFAAMLIIGFIGSALSPEGSPGPVYSLAVLIIPILVAVKVALPKGAKSLAAKSGKVTNDQNTLAFKSEEKSDLANNESSIDTTMVCENIASNNCANIEKTYRVAGTSFHVDNIINIATENVDYDYSKKELIENDLTDERIWQYEFFPSDVKLIPEPDNPEDPNAIKVIVDGEHIGYIKAGSCKHLLKMIKENRILDISCEIGGGPFKIVREEYDEDKEKDVYTLEKDETNFFAVLTIRELQD